MISKVVNVVSIDLKTGTHIDWTYTMYIAKTCINKSNVTYVSMATKYPIIKNRAFFKMFNIFDIRKYRVSHKKYPLWQNMTLLHQILQ